MTRPRRDPRAERAATQVSIVARPRFDRSLPALSARRLRRNPRAEQAAQVTASAPRLRLDRAQRISSSPVAQPSAPHERVDEAPRVRTIEAPAYLVAVVADAPAGRLTPHDRQLLGAARVLARDTGAVVLVCFHDVDDAGSAGADRVLSIATKPDAYDPSALAGALAAMLKGLAPRHVLFAETPSCGDLARRVALSMKEPLFTRCEALSVSSVSRASGGRRIEQRTAPPRLMAVLPDAVAAYAGDPREARPLRAETRNDFQTKSAIVSVEEIPADPASVPLALADFVTAAGNGITDLAVFRRLVAALDATPGASRVLCDAGLMPRESQVGASGTVLSATCYFALGIAGAPQHLQGVADCQHVVAVNTDLHAAMIARAGLAIVQDAQLVMPALLDVLAREDQS